MNTTPVDIGANENRPQAGDLRLFTRAGHLWLRNADGHERRINSPEKITLSSPLTGATTTAAPLVDELVYATPAGTIAAHALVLPCGNDSFVGMRKRFQSSAIITALTVTIAGTGGVDATSPAGTALTAAAVGLTYEWECISITNGVAVYLRNDL